VGVSITLPGAKVADLDSVAGAVVGPETTDWIDVSVTVRHGMPHWPDNPPIVLERVLDIGRGDACDVSHLAMGVHSGTHMDRPVHFFQGAPARAILRPIGGQSPGRAVSAQAMP
jgi:putative cyclase